jgi:Xaa-Pro aminopeptidase
VSWIYDRPEFRKATIGIAGLTSSHFAHVRAAEGEANWQSVEILKQAFPEARFVSATNVLGRARWRKSTEEIDFLRKGTAVAEATLDALYASARAGVSERHVFAHMMFANADAGGSFPPMVGWVSGGLHQHFHRLEQPTFRTLRADDVILVEIEGRWGGYVAQIDQTVAFGVTDPILQDAMRFVGDAFDRIMGVLKPGVTVAELVAAGRLDALGGRITTSIGGHGRGTGDDGPLLTARNLESAGIGNIVIEEGCSFALKPAAALDGKADFARWGDTVVVTETGAERLGTRPRELRNIM